jgi:hypothetical protein
MIVALTALTVVMAFLVVGVASYLILDWLIPEKGDDWRGPRALSIAPLAVLTPEDALGWLWLYCELLIGLLVLWAVWSYVGPWVLRRFPRTAQLFSALLPLAEDRRRTYGERPRWEDASPRVKVTDGPSMLELVKGIRPGQQPTDGGKR